MEHHKGPDQEFVPANRRVFLTPTEWGEGGGQDVGRNFRSEEKLSRNESAKMDAREGGKEEEEGDWF